MAGVMTTSTSSKMALMRAASRGLGRRVPPRCAGWRCGRRPMPSSECAARGAPGAASSRRRRGCRGGNGLRCVRPRRGFRSPGRVRRHRGRARVTGRRPRRRRLAARFPTRPRMPIGLFVLIAILSRAGVRAAAATKPPSGAGAVVVTSRKSAASSTVRVMGPLTLSPCHASSCGDERDTIALRLHAEEAAPRRRSSDRSAAVGAHSERGQASGDGGCGSAAAAAGGSGGVPRVAGRPERRRFSERPDRHLGHIRLADHDRSGRPQSAHHLSVVLLDRSVCGRAPSGQLAGDVDVVLDRDGDPEKRQSFACIDAALRVGRFGAGLVGAHGAVGVELGVESADPLEVHLQQLVVMSPCLPPACGPVPPHPRRPSLPCPWERPT